MTYTTPLTAIEPLITTSSSSPSISCLATAIPTSRNPQRVLSRSLNASSPRNDTSLRSQILGPLVATMVDIIKELLLSHHSPKDSSKQEGALF